MSFAKKYAASGFPGNGLTAVNNARAAGLSDLQIITIGQQQGINWGEKARSSLLGGLQQSQNNTISGLESRLSEQASQFQQQMLQVQEQTRQQQAAYQQQFQQQVQQVQEQMRQQQAAYERQIQSMENAQRAYVPQAESTAQETQTSELQAPSGGRRQLSSLAIIEGLGTNANPLSGLQLA